MCLTGGFLTYSSITIWTIYIGVPVKFTYFLVGVFLNRICILFPTFLYCLLCSHFPIGWPTTTNRQFHHHNNIVRWCEIFFRSAAMTLWQVVWSNNYSYYFGDLKILRSRQLEFQIHTQHQSSVRSFRRRHWRRLGISSSTVPFALTTGPLLCWVQFFFASVTGAFPAFGLHKHF